MTDQRLSGRDRSTERSADKKPTQIIDDSRCLHAVIDMVTDCAIYVLDREGIIVSWNPGAERLTGYSSTEIIGRHFSCLFAEEDQHAGKPNELLSIAERAGRFEEEGWRVRKNGDRLQVLAVVDAIRDHQGQVVGFAEVTRDRTERNRSEEALRRSEERFRRVVEATPNAMVMIDLAGRI